MWERAARRADLPLAYSHGFHPQPKIHIASPLPLGYSSRCEILDLRLNEEVDISDLLGRLQDALPQGIRVLGAERVDPDAPALQSLLMAAEYEVDLPETCDPASVARQIETWMNSATCIRERRGRPYDLRPLVEDLHLEADNLDRRPRLYMRLTAREGATGRPDEVLETLGIPVDDSSVERTSLLFRE